MLNKIRANSYTARIRRLESDLQEIEMIRALQTEHISEASIMEETGNTVQVEISSEHSQSIASTDLKSQVSFQIEFTK